MLSGGQNRFVIPSEHLAKRIALAHAIQNNAWGINTATGLMTIQEVLEAGGFRNHSLFGNIQALKEATDSGDVSRQVRLRRVIVNEISSHSEYLEYLEYIVRHTPSALLLGTRRFADKAELAREIRETAQKREAPVTKAEIEKVATDLRLNHPKAWERLDGLRLVVVRLEGKNSREQLAVALAVEQGLGDEDVNVPRVAFDTLKKIIPSLNPKDRLVVALAVEQRLGDKDEHVRWVAIDVLREIIPSLNPKDRLDIALAVKKAKRFLKFRE